MQFWMQLYACLHASWSAQAVDAQGHVVYAGNAAQAWIVACSERIAYVVS